ncbi:hypothetical protein VPH35_011066 [Triticum aestivum]
MDGQNVRSSAMYLLLPSVEPRCLSWQQVTDILHLHLFTPEMNRARTHLLLLLASVTNLFLGKSLVPCMIGRNSTICVSKTISWFSSWNQWQIVNCVSKTSKSFHFP